MEDITKAVSLDAKRDGDLLYVIGMTRPELGGSEFYAMLGATGNRVPQVDAAAAKSLYEKVAAVTDAELCHSLHTPVFGGLGVGFAKVAIAGHLGLQIDIDAIPAAPGMLPCEVLFSASNSRFIATVSPCACGKFESMLEGVPFAKVGKVAIEPALIIKVGGTVYEMDVDDLTEAYTATLDGV
jgi:phosphoribosylformylglycinamidine synthase